MGNNCDFRSPVFMLVYTFEERAKNKQKWSKYREYLEKGFEQDYKDVENGTGIKSRLADTDELREETLAEISKSIVIHRRKVTD